MIDLHLRRTPASGDLLPVRLTPLLVRWSEPRAKLRGQELRLALSLSLDDDACAGFVLDFAGQGARIEATAQGASAPLLVWAFHALATATKCEVVAPTPPPSLAEARAYLEVYEADVNTATAIYLNRLSDLLFRQRERLRYRSQLCFPSSFYVVRRAPRHAAR